jgi:phosphoglucosamine mutase
VSLKFGTDGVRGLANQELTPELVCALGRAAARVFGIDSPFLVGRDTRISGPMLEAALTAGLTSEGAKVVHLGVLPTPGVAALAAAQAAPGAVISASHNPFPDNGIKFFAPGGRKLPDATERELEAVLREVLDTGAEHAVTGAGIGRVHEAATDAVDRYAAAVVESLGGRRLDGMRIVLDCANGAASAVAPGVFRALGASVRVLFAEPDGTNINDGCGSTHPAALQSAVVEHGADAGLAFDGDADRVLAVDGAGGLVDGDHLLAICAQDMRDRGRLTDDAVVVTVMTNLGFRLAMREAGIHVEETAVGDRYVLERLEARGWSLGGEQSGHVIFRDIATTGDGLLTGLQLLDVVHRSGSPLDRLAAGAMTRLPQVLRNLRVADRDALEGASAVWDAVKMAEADLGDTGRVLIRASGTEPLVRVMVEAPTDDLAALVCERLCLVVAEQLGTPESGQ